MNQKQKIKEIILKVATLPLQITFVGKKCIKKYILRTDKKGKGIFLNKREY